MKKFNMIMFEITLISAYLVNLIGMFSFKPIDIFLGNILAWLIIVIIVFITEKICKDSDVK